MAFLYQYDAPAQAASNTDALSVGISGLASFQHNNPQAYTSKGHSTWYVYEDRKEIGVQRDLLSTLDTKEKKS